MSDARTRRLAERISKLVAELLERRIKDPRLGFVTVTEVRLTGDWREAKVFYTVFGTPEEQADTADALASATGIIRSEVGRIIGLRHAPSIEFVADALPDSARRIDDLVAAARQADEELAQAREGATWAGDPDPYKKPADDDDGRLGRGRGRRPRRRRRNRRRRTRMTAPSGLVIVDKPGGMTSHDVVARVRRLAGTRRVGHAGTLDPMATGVLVVGVEKATRLLGYLTLTEKTYAATIRLGQSTSTDDAEGEPTGGSPATDIVPGALDAEIAELTGDIWQVPPGVSAIKVNGQRAYKLTRAGAAPELAARPVTVYEFTVTDIRQQGDFLDIDAVIRCSSGTYIRALARDLGAALGTGGHLTALRRTAVGPYDLAQAHTLQELEDQKRQNLPIERTEAPVAPEFPAHPAPTSAAATAPPLPQPRPPPPRPSRG